MKKNLLVALIAVSAIGIYHFQTSETSKPRSKSLIAEYKSRKSAYKADKRERLAQGHPDKHAEIQRMLRTGHGQEAPTYAPGHLIKEFDQARRGSQNARLANSYNFVERGPANIAGRTRALVIDAADETQSTWFVGAATGGVWKTTDGGGTWTSSSSGLPSLGTNALAQSAANPDVFYAGTGEPNYSDINGTGLFKSEDHGASWNQIMKPEDYPDVQMVGRIIVNPDNEDEVIVVGRSSLYSLNSTTGGAYRSADGGDTWSKILTASTPVDQVVYTPNDWQTQYLSVRFVGVYKSTDGGVTWKQKNGGLRPDGRIELSVSEVDPNIVWASISCGNGCAELFVSKDGAESWSFVSEASADDNFDFLIQGDYDNTLLAHPYNADKVYVGGVDLWEFTLTDSTRTSDYLTASENGTEEFMSLINFGTEYYGGRVDIGEVGFNDAISVEIRFGQGKQLAHRFTVDMQGPGVPADDYEYQDYVEVPFQVWDVTNDKQLMASFRDQQEDGTWNLVEENTSGPTADHSREYIYVHLRDYSETADTLITEDGGQENQQMYNIWPVGPIGSTFDPEALPVSNFAISKKAGQDIVRTSFNISDSRGQHQGNNSNAQDVPRTEDGIHPDHHGIHVINKNDNDKTFNLLTTNDGGVYLSKNSTEPGIADDDFDYVSLGYNSTQFYGADKMPGQNRYVGGMQDNGSHMSPAGEDSNSETHFDFAFYGDGFETLWNNRDANKVIVSVYNNFFVKTEDGGASWQLANSGIAEDDGPFVSRLSNSRFYPDRLYAIGSNGVYVSTDFGSNWSLSTVSPDEWSYIGSPDVEVSHADGDVVWAGGYMSENRRLYVSTDAGESFDPTGNYPDTTMGYVSGIGTHPSDPNTAFALFSTDGLPKVLKTTDLGDTWADITGFDPTTGKSTRGFPNVATNCLISFTNDPDHLWVGTEIGIVESLDGGLNWSLLNSNLPMVNVYDMKIQDDQIVLATYGRGIWSVTIPEIEQKIVFAPTITSVSVDTDGKTTFTMQYDAEFDSTEIVIGNSVAAVVPANELGEVTFVTENLGLNGVKNMTTKAYLDDDNFNSQVAKAMFYEVSDEVDEYGTTFAGAIDDFATDGLQMAFESGFDDLALHSDHDYPEATDLIAVLKSPIRVASSNATITYRDIAIIETGEDSTEFGDDEFWDYAIVEGSLDGITWTPLLDGYDASLHEDWLDAYENDEIGKKEMLKDQTINLLDTYEAGDIVQIRFRLFSDANTVGWGWVIDDLYIQSEPLSTDRSTQDLRVYPNPMKETAHLDVKAKNEGKAVVMDLQGRVVWEQTFAAGNHQYKLERNQLRAGLYIVKVQDGEEQMTQKLIIQ